MNGVRGRLTFAPLVSSDWLAANLDAPGLRIVDVRGTVLPPGNPNRYLSKRSDYERSHVPGAVFLDWTRDIVDTADPVPIQIAPVREFAAAMGKLGIGDGVRVIAYDDYNHIFAGRLAWALRYYGHDEVQVLDGGWSRWTSEGRPVTEELPHPEPVQFTANRRAELRRSAEEVASALGRLDVLLVDARPPEQFAGRVSAARRAGHVPGARNVPYKSLIDPATGRFRTGAEIARAFAEAGVDVAKLPRDIIVYCNAGVSCTVPLTALRILGRDDVAVYDGSWNEWGNDDSRPLDTGEEA